MFYVHFMSMQAVAINATDEASKQNINLTSASRYSSFLATNGIHEQDTEAIASPRQKTNQNIKIRLKKHQGITKNRKMFFEKRRREKECA